LQQKLSLDLVQLHTVSRQPKLRLLILRDATSHEITRVREVRRRRDGCSWRDRSGFAPPP
jgi:hypothetical protein